MSNNVDWQKKYEILRSKYMNAIDASFRLGYQQGQKDAEVEQLQMQIQQAEQAAAEAEAAAMQEGPMEEPGMPMEEAPMEEAPMEDGEMGGSELDANVDELESLVRSEKEIDFSGLMKSMYKFQETEEVKGDQSKMEKMEKINSILKKWDEEEKTEDTE